MPPSQGRLAAHVGAGIVVTRVLGFVRERVFAHYFGNGIEADAFRAALRIPNAIRNLLGEGTLSASFIPVFAGMLERGEEEDASRLAGIIASLLIVLTAVAAILGIVLAPIITDFAAPGFEGYERDLTVKLVRIMFPMSGALILSAWCLGVLNTYRKFFLSYAAPAVWNIAQIATLIALGGHLAGASLVTALAWGALTGGILQIGIQLPTVLKLVQRIRWGFDVSAPGVRAVARAWLPVVFGAGVVQVSSVIDTQLASFLGSGAVATLGYAQLIAILPISLFGVSVAAVALPELSRDAATDANDLIRLRLSEGLRQVIFFAIPSAFMFATLAPQIVGALFQTGAFSARDTSVVAGVLAAYSLAIPAQASIKLLASGHYALGDTRTPVRIAVLSVVVSAVAAFALMRYFDAAGIALGASAGAYLNVTLNSIALRRRVGRTATPDAYRSVGATAIGATAAAWLSAEAAGLAGETLWLSVVAGLSTFTVVYAVTTLGLRHPEATRIMRALKRSMSHD
ncbi:MAG: murein biosynthesis integral membrane protein MurJ [Gemmatimonadales bacterium]